MSDFVVACVYKKGGEFTADHVRFLAESVHKHNNVRIKCLTDDINMDVAGVDVVPLEHGWPGWWSKMELFKHDFGPTLYLDLDTVVIRELQPPGERFTMLPALDPRHKFGSGCMSWHTPPRELFTIFEQNAQMYMAEYKTTAKWGDQGFIRDHVAEQPDTFGDEFRSYKAHCQNGVPEGTKVVYFHGKPRPWDSGIDLIPANVWFVIASGPSLTQEDVDAVRGHGTVVAVNNAGFTAPWADYLYAGDTHWWTKYNEDCNFAGTKLTISRYHFRWGAKHLQHGGFKEQFGKSKINLGGKDSANSGFQALNYAITQGATHIALLGFDYQHSGGKTHFHGDHPRPMKNAPNPDQWLATMEKAAAHGTHGSKVINCSRESAITCFDRMSVQDFIDEHC